MHPTPLRSRPHPSGILPAVRMLVADADERRAGGVVLLLPPLLGGGIIDEVNELAVFKILVAPAVLALFFAELLGGGVCLAIGIGDRRIKGRCVIADVPVH